MNTGVYKITNLITNKAYIGSTTRGFNIRFSQHLNYLSKNKHVNKRLQRSFNKYGKDMFIFEIIERCDKAYCIEREQYWIDLFKSYNPEFGYNICRFAGNTLGTKRTDEQKLNISKSLIGKCSGSKHPMWGKKRKPTMLGKKHTQEALLKMKNRIISEETKIKLKEAHKNRNWVGENHPRFGVKLTGEALRRNQTLRIGIPSTATRKSVVIFDLNNNLLGEFDCMTHLSEKFNIPISAISKVCNRENHIFKNKYIIMLKNDWENN